MVLFFVHGMQYQSIGNFSVRNSASSVIFRCPRCHVTFAAFICRFHRHFVILTIVFTVPPALPRLCICMGHTSLPERKTEQIFSSDFGSPTNYYRKTNLMRTEGSAHTSWAGTAWPSTQLELKRHVRALE